MSSLPQVSIIILNYNSFKDTIECVDSLENVTYPNYNIIIVDNDSKDESLKILKIIYGNSDKHIVIESKANFGYASGNNIGIKYALEQGTEYICILNNDVIVEKGFLEPLIKVIENNKEVGIVGPCICEYDDKEIVQALGANINLYRGLAQANFKGRKTCEIKEDFSEVDYLGGACFLLRSSILKTVGFIPENYFLFFEETEFCLRIKRAGFKLLCIHNSRVYHKGSATISKFKGLSYYFLNRNRVVFMRRNASVFQRVIFYFYIIFETAGRILIRHESAYLLKYYYYGLKADTDIIELNKINEFIDGGKQNEFKQQN